MASPFSCFNAEFSLVHIAFALKHIVKLYYQWQHFVIVLDNHTAETGLALLMMDLSIKDLGDSRQ